MRLANGIVYFLCGFIAVSVVLLTTAALAELGANAKKGIYEYVCYKNGGCK